MQTVLLINYFEVNVLNLRGTSIHKVKKIEFVSKHKAMVMLITFSNNGKDTMILEKKKGKKLIYFHCHESFPEEKAVITFPDNKLYIATDVREKLCDNYKWECNDPNDNELPHFDLSAFRKKQQEIENFKKSLDKKQIAK